MLKLNLNQVRSYEVEQEGLKVRICPLNKKEDLELEKRFTSGRMSMERGLKKKGSDKVLFPETDYFSLNLERAKKTWKEWNLVDEKSKEVPCDPSQIELLFLNYYDEFARPILDKLDEAIFKVVKEEKDQMESERKN
ncbi:MAG: hypothetical protein OEY59_00990 [Deltaproteobacteria bacterium]|nr:hypothetical protein [Deltaproteobacteria bacterium]